VKGKALSVPRNAVRWANGFESNMPDWPTARRVAVSDRLLYLCREARTLFLKHEALFAGDARFASVLESIQEVVAYADIGISEGDIDVLKGPNPLMPPPSIPTAVQINVTDFSARTKAIMDAERRSAMPPPPGFPKPPGVK
jgi:hypothetical protein